MTSDVLEKSKTSNNNASLVTAPRGNLLVEMKNVNVKYGPRTVSCIAKIIVSVRRANASSISKVLKDINWEVRQGERWHLQGTNGNFLFLFQS